MSPGMVGMETNFAGMDGDGDRYPSPCSSLVWNSNRREKLNLLSYKKIFKRANTYTELVVFFPSVSHNYR